MPHIHEKIDFTAEVFVVYKNKVLLRKHDKYDIWLSVGGHIELDEDSNQAAIREVKEEVGLDIKLIDKREFKGEDEQSRQLIPPVGLSRHRISDTHEHITFVYFATTSNDNVIPEKAEDVWKWCTKEDIDQLEDIPLDAVYWAKRAIDEVR